MTDTREALVPGLLKYALSTAPAPLAVTTASTTTSGTINLGVFNGGKTIYCSELVVFVPIGPTATDLSETTPDASVNTARWAISSIQIVDGDSVDIGSGQFAQFTFDARDPSDYLIDYSLVLGLTAQVNAVPGIFQYVVRELSGPDPDHLTIHSDTFPLDKQPPVLSLTNFVATAPDAPTAPRTAFGNGTPVRLSWESTGTWFQLYVRDNPRPVYAGSATSYVLTGGLATDTTFVLAAALTGDPSGDSSGFRTIYRYASLTVTVTDPDLTPRSVVASGSVRAGSAGMSSPGPVSGASLSATGAVTGVAVTAGTITATAKATAAALEVSGRSDLLDVTAKGTTNLAGTQISGPLQVTVPATLAGATVNGNLGVSAQATLAQATVTQLLNASPATVRLMGAPRGLPATNATYRAPTDGFVVGYIWNTSGASADELGWIWASTEGTTVTATGGSIVACTGFFSNTVGTNNTSIVLPVRNGATFSTFVKDYSGKSGKAFTWVPLGVGNPAAIETEAAAPDGAEPPDGARVERHAVDDLIRVLEGAEGDDGNRLREALSRVLRAG